MSGENYTVTYTVEAPMDVQTKATIADGLNVNELIYEVWWTSEDGTIDLKDAQRLYQARAEMAKVPVDGKVVNRANVTLNLVKDQHYTILFWAQVKGTGVYNTTDLVKVHYNTDNLKEAYYANDDALAAFYAVDFVNDGIAKNSKVILKRPFAQVNLATLNDRDPKNNPEDYSITLVNSKMTLNKVPTQFNVATSDVDGDAVIEFKYNGVPSTAVAHTNTATGAEYYYAGMNYVFAGANLELTYQIQTRLNGSEALAEITNTIPNVPVKENYRTNIVGNLLTSKTDYEVIVDAGFNTNDNSGNIEVVGEGIVKNMNGDYEVTSERGLAYAINNLFEEGGNFYLTKELYEMAGYDVTAPSVPEDIVLNIYGEVPVVTRAGSDVAAVTGVTITGLKAALIETNDGTVSFSGIKVQGTDENSETPAFIATNNGTADFTSCETTTQDYIAENTGTVTESDNRVSKDNNIVTEGNDNGTSLTKVSTADELVAALENKKDVLFMNDIKIEPAKMSNAYGKTGINVKFGQTIDGNNHTLNIKGAGGTWDSGINTTGGIIKNLTVTGSFRGIFINHTSEHSEKVVLEYVTIGGSGTVYTISCDQGLYQTIEATNCTFNGWTSFAATAGEAKFVNCNFGEGSGYKYCRPYSNTEFVNCTFGSGYAVDTTQATVTFTNCIWNVNVCNITDLQAAVTNAKDQTFIKFDDDIEGNVTVIQKQGVKITIDGNGKKYYGSIKVHSNSNHYADAALTIKNVNFETSVASLNFIEALENGAERYSTNITAENCTFTATGDAVNTAVGLQIKASKWAKVLNCTAADMHSLIQAQSCDETVVVNGCTINGKNGVAFKQVKSATVEGTTITALEYGIRFDGNTDNYGITVKNNNVTAVQPFIVRKMTGKNNTITLEGTNTLTSKDEDPYQIVITNGSDDAEYVEPTGTYTLKGAEDYIVYPNTIYCSTAITDKNAVRYVGDAFESGSMDNALWINNYIFDDAAAIVVENKTYNAIIIENCTGNLKNDVLTIKNDNSSVLILQNLDLTLAEGKKLIKTANPYYQVFMENITINGEKMTQASIAKYLENVAWYQVVEEI